MFFKRWGINPCLARSSIVLHHSPLSRGLWVTSVASLNVSLRSASLTPADLLHPFLPASPQLTVSHFFLQVWTWLQCPEVPICCLAHKNLDPWEPSEHILLLFLICDHQSQGNSFLKLIPSPSNAKCLSVGMGIERMPSSFCFIRKLIMHT